MLRSVNKDLFLNFDLIDHIQMDLRETEEGAPPSGTVTITMSTGFQYTAPVWQVLPALKSAGCIGPSAVVFLGMEEKLVLEFQSRRGAKYIARNGDGKVYAFERLPELDGHTWKAYDSAGQFLHPLQGDFKGLPYLSETPYRISDILRDLSE